MDRRALAWLLAASLAALGTAEALSSASAKSASAPHKKSAAAAHKKHKKDSEKVETKRPSHAIDQAAAGDVAPLSPALTATNRPASEANNSAMARALSRMRQ